MFKLTVIAGPNRGTSYPLQEGELSFGRQAGNHVVLASSKVSKQHCVLVVDNSGVVVKDQGSSNGTFVNGILTKVKRLVPGDRLSVGDFVMELTRQSERPAAPPAPLQGNVVPFPTRQLPRPQQMAAHSTLPTLGSLGASTVPSAPAAPSTPAEKAKVFLENKVMPTFYNMALKNEWRVVVAWIFGIFAVANLLISVFPILQANQTAIINEARKRARFMAKQMADRNAPILAAGAITKVETAGAELGDGVRVAVLTDVELRVMAPARMMNQFFGSTPEAPLAKKAAIYFNEGGTKTVEKVDGDTVIAIEPVSIYLPSKSKNVVTAMAIVSLDASTSVPGFADLSLVYGETLILTALIGLLLYFILYRVTLKPFEILNEDMDKVLKGELGQVTREFKFEEMNSLWEIIQSSLQRATRGGGELGSGGGGGSDLSPEDLAGPFRLLGSQTKMGVVVCDASKGVVFMNPLFEEISGIRAEGASGQPLSSLARDQAFSSLVEDLFGRALPGSDGVSEDTDFSGVSYRLHASAIGSATGGVRAFVLVALKAEGSS